LFITFFFDEHFPDESDLQDVELHSNQLIFIEDVDHVFASDKGFFGAVRNLILSTKCPIIMTCSDLTCDLEKLCMSIDEIFVLNFSPPPLLRFATYLQMIWCTLGSSVTFLSLCFSFYSFLLIVFIVLLLMSSLLMRTH
jgi:hypothetical protein